MTEFKPLQLNIFAKSKTGSNGKEFKVFFTTLPNADKATRVKFRGENNLPAKFPCVIEVTRGNANLANETYTDATTGEEKKAPVLWISDYKYIGEYVDTSLDEYFK